MIELCALALMRDTSKLVALSHSTPAFVKAQIQIYSPAGEGLLLFSVDISILSLQPQLTRDFVVGPGKDNPIWMDE